MTKQRWRGTAILIGFGVLVAGLLFASNQGFVVSYSLYGPASSASGTNWIGLPYRTGNLQTAADLFASLGGAASVASVSRYQPVTGTFQVYSGNAQDNFNLVPGEGLRLVMNVTMNYKIFGSHDPTRVVTLLGPQDSFNGANWYSHPYDAKSTTVGTLRSELGAQNAASVARWLPASDDVQVYTGALTDQNFTLLAGEAYKVTMTRTLQFVPQTVP